MFRLVIRINGDSLIISRMMFIMEMRCDFGGQNRFFRFYIAEVLYQRVNNIVL